MRLTCLRGAAEIALNNGISAVVEEPRAFAGRYNGTFAVVEVPLMAPAQHTKKHAPHGSVFFSFSPASCSDWNVPASLHHSFSTS